MSQAPNAPPPHASSLHWPARPLFQTHFRCRRRPPPHRVRATNTAPFHEKRPGERPIPQPHVRRTRPYHTTVVHTATHTTTTRVTISLLCYQMCVIRQLAPSGRCSRRHMPADHPLPSRRRVHGRMLLTHCYPAPARPPPRAIQQRPVAPSPHRYRRIAPVAHTGDWRPMSVRRLASAPPALLPLLPASAPPYGSTAGRDQGAVFRCSVPARGSCRSCGCAIRVMQVMRRRRWLRWLRARG